MRDFWGRSIQRIERWILAIAPSRSRSNVEVGIMQSDNEPQREVSSPLWASYVAGLFDGDGTVVISYNSEKRRYQQLVVSVSNTFVPVLGKLKSIYGGSIDSLGQPRRNLRAKFCYQWKLTGRQKQLCFLQDILPYVIIKRQRVELGLAFLQLVRSQGASKERLDPLEVTQRHVVAEALRVLNKRGI
ncbi:hypothetical protein LCGC14_0648170 [marine sediment metagenome]|uniref:Homing endonuclease LAGLIDADG domain-containing protein n=1 Tax=marine sediment metagenome TaxID=412755 RepID=A0A0F9R2E7_9ZZZZ